MNAPRTGGLELRIDRILPVTIVLAYRPNR